MCAFHTCPRTSLHGTVTWRNRKRTLFGIAPGCANLRAKLRIVLAPGLFGHCQELLRTFDMVTKYVRFQNLRVLCEFRTFDGYLCVSHRPNHKLQMNTYWCAFEVQGMFFLCLNCVSFDRFRTEHRRVQAENRRVKSSVLPSQKLGRSPNQIGTNIIYIRSSADKGTGNKKSMVFICFQRIL